MRRQDLIKIFLDRGFQLDGKTLDFFTGNPDKVQDFFTVVSLLKTRPTIITLEFIEKLIRRENTEVLKTFEKGNKLTTTDDVREFLNNRYKNMIKLFSHRQELVNLISINKITEKTNKFSLIVMIKEKNEDEKSLLVEDPTGEIKIFVPEDQLEDFNLLLPDEVLGLVCENKEIFWAKKIVYPDIPLTKNIPTATDEIYCLFVSDFHFDKNINQNYYEKFLSWLRENRVKKMCLFVLGGISEDKKDVEHFLSQIPEEFITFYLRTDEDSKAAFNKIRVLDDPCILKIHNIKIFLSSGKFFEKYQKIWNIVPEKLYLTLVKKRHLDPVFDLSTAAENDPFLLDVVPDIFVCGYFCKPGALNYKGMTIISNGSFVENPVFWLVNLKTRESIKIEFT